MWPLLPSAIVPPDGRTLRQREKKTMRNEASRPFGLGKDGPYGGCDDAPAPRTLGGLASRGGGLHAFFPHPTTGRVVLMKRMLLLVTVALVMAAMMAFGAGAASAQERTDQVEFINAFCSNPQADKVFPRVLLVPAETPNPFRCAGPPL